MKGQRINLAIGLRILVALTIFCVISPAGSAVTSSSTSSATTTDAAATNMVVDFTSTSFSSTVSPGDSGVINLVIKNSGGRKADNVQVMLTSTGIIRTDKSFFVGQMDPSESKTIPVIFSVAQDAKTGLAAVQVRINYDGFDSTGTSQNNKLTTWEIPLNILSNPLFQITPAKTAYNRDNVEDLTLEGLAKDRVKALEASLSSNCSTIIGSSKRYVGDVAANTPFNMTYSIKPTSTGACMTVLSMSYTDQSGSKSTSAISIGLNVADAGVDFKVVNVTYDPTGPGEDTDLRVSLRNVGSADANDVTLYLNITSPFAPVGTSEMYLPQVKAREQADVDFKLAVGWTADTTAYSIPMTITYKVGGTTYAATKYLGVDVVGRVTLEVMDVQTSGGNVRIDVANIGTRTADGVKATLIVPYATTGTLATGTGRARGGDNASVRPGENASLGQGMQRIISYKSDIKSTKQTTFTFATTATGPATLEIEYSGPNNERITQTERISLSGGTTSLRGTTTSTSTSWTTYALVAAVLVAAYLIYRKYKGGKSK